MSWPDSLPPSTRRSLDRAARLVPAHHRSEWRREWEGELAFVIERLDRRPAAAQCEAFHQIARAARRDALWLRFHPARGWEERRRADRRRRALLVALDDASVASSHPTGGFGIMSRLALDSKLALRRLVRSPRYTCLVVGVLALGIGATATLATLVEAVLIRPLPYRDAARLVRALTFDAREQQLDWASWAQLQSWRQAESFERVGYSTTFPAIWKREQGSLRVQRAYVPPDYFELFGIRPAVGASFTLDRDGVVLSHRLWRRQLGSDPDVIGRSIELDGRLYTIRAVAPGTVYAHDFGGASAELWLARSLDDTSEDPDFRVFTFYGRLRHGVTVQAAENELSSLNRALVIERPDVYQGLDVRVEELHESHVGHLRTALWLLLGAVALVLLIVTLNLSNLVLGRTVARGKELAIHIALGARPREMIRAVTLENVLLAASGGILGIAMSRVLLAILPRVVDVSFPREAELVGGATHLGIGLLLVILTACLFGAAPALVTLRRDIAGNLSGVGRGSTGKRRVNRLLIAVQVALSVPLLMGAILLTRSVVHLRNDGLGLEPERILSMRVSLPREWIGEPVPENFARIAQFFEQTLSDIRAQPGVVDAAAAVFPPFLADEADRARIEIEGIPVAEPSETPRALMHLVTPRFFETLGTRLIAGRGFEGRDRSGSTPVMIVSRELERRFFPDRDPIGRTITTEWGFTPGASRTRTIVGVVEDVAHLGPAAAIEPQIYIPHAQSPFPSMALVVRTATEPEPLFRAIRSALVEREPQLLLEDTVTLDEALAQSIREPRFYARLLTLFAGAAALVSALGLYGLLSYRVATEHRELAIRAALGASPRRLLNGVYRSGLTVTGAGLVAGFILAVALAQFLRSMLHGVGAYDPWTLIATPLLIVATGMLASWLPARRASRVAVVDALRLEE